MDFWFPETLTAVVIANQQNKGKGLTNFNFFFLVFELSNIYFYRTTYFFLENIVCFVFDLSVLDFFNMATFVFKETQ